MFGVKIDAETHGFLTQLGAFGETYADIVARIVKHYAMCYDHTAQQQTIIALESFGVTTA
jgi:hypothetical protein